jgi:hypothetical protein
MEDSYLLARDSQECSRPACGTTNMRRSSGQSGSCQRLLLFLPEIWSEFEGKLAEYPHLIRLSFAAVAAGTHPMTQTNS